MANSRPQYRTLVKVLDDLVRKVNVGVFNSLGAEEINRSYLPLLRATNEAERVLDRERRTRPRHKPPEAGSGDNNPTQP